MQSKCLTVILNSTELVSIVRSINIFAFFSDERVFNIESYFRTDFLLILYYTLVTSKLEYGSVVWNSLTTTDSTKLENIQRKFISLCTYRFVPTFSDTVLTMRCIYTTHATRALQGRDLSGESAPSVNMGDTHNKSLRGQRLSTGQRRLAQRGVCGELPRSVQSTLESSRRERFKTDASFQELGIHVMVITVTNVVIVVTSHHRRLHCRCHVTVFPSFLSSHRHQRCRQFAVTILTLASSLSLQKFRHRQHNLVIGNVVSPPESSSLSGHRQCSFLVMSSLSSRRHHHLLVATSASSSS
ncbi:hypothetical protein ANN_22133 [Periplaneta americana]|uniref:Uncharacterized protein n=1 Tax=Periplaneta americana TaxID=6978 RepID=A0ABQ8S7A9_PERAM|nr:hypothetical protein ANN_22133 [Periplaneta americana]